MKISATGWNRDMGPTVIGEFDLDSVKPKQSGEKFSFDGIGFYKTGYYRRAADLYWGKSLKLTGNYKLRLELTASDIRKLFWEVHGPLLTADLVEHFGFVVYKDLKEKILSFPAHWDPKLRIPRGQVVAAASIVSPKY